MNQFTFREGTCDMNVYYDVVARNEYKLPLLEPNDVVIDIGAHIGSFSYKAYMQGSRTIIAFEANKENAEIARKNLLPYNVPVVQLGIFSKHGTLYHSGFTQGVGELNTGGGNLFGTSGETVKTIPLDDVLQTYGKIKVLKLDCEGSEWDILYTSSMLDKVEYLTMEYHEVYTSMEGMTIEPERCKADVLMEYLKDVWKFSKITSIHHNNSNLGMIYAIKE